MMLYDNYIKALQRNLDRMRYEVHITYNHTYYDKIHTLHDVLYINDLNISTIKHELYILHQYKYIHIEILTSKIINDRIKTHHV